MKKTVPSYVITRKRKYADAFEKAGYDTVAGHLRECAEVELLLACSHCDHRKYVTYHCQTRVCPICSYWASVTRAQFIEKLVGKMEFPKMLTLTIPLQNKSPRETIKYLRKCFQKLRDRKVFKTVQGGAYQIEVKVKKGYFNIHMHIILDAPFIHYTQLYKAWADITGHAGVQIDIRAAKTPKQRAYIVKYSQKSAELRADGADVVAWYEAVKGSRLFGTFGEWYNAKLEDLLDPDEEMPEPPVCEGCGKSGCAYFARDGFFLYGKDWDEIKGFVITKSFPEWRPLPEPYPPEFDDNQIEMIFEELAITQRSETNVII